MICERCRLEYYSAICPRCYYVRRETTMAEINRRQEEIGEMEERKGDGEGDALYSWNDWCDVAIR